MLVRELLTDELRWIKGSMAKDSDGNSIDYESSDAVCWCLMGAIRKCYDNWDEVLDRIREEIGQESIINWNDNSDRTFEDVKNLIKSLDI